MTTHPVGATRTVYDQFQEWGGLWGVRAAWRCFMLRAAGPRAGTLKLLERLANRRKMWDGTVLVVLSLVLVGCSSIASMRKPGEKMVRTPEETKEKYACAPYRKTLLQLEDVQVLPEMVMPGKEINHRIRYAFCPFTPSSTLKGGITRIVVFKGEQIFGDSTNYEFKPGTWTVDVFIGIPKEAMSGVYALDVVLRYGNQTLKASNSFIVKSR